MKTVIFRLTVTTGLLLLLSTSGISSQDKGVKITNSLGMEFAYIPPGTFMMGSAISPSEVEKRYGGRARWYKDEHPQHRVTLMSGFYMQTTEVTQSQWKAVMGSNPSKFKGDNRPVEKVSWNDVQEFIQKLNQREGSNKYRLPTEAEWEYAARAGSTTRFSFGDDKGRLGDYAWYGGNSGSQTHPVAQKKPNNWGFYDMHGNVYEWCQDRKGDYLSGSVSDPKGPYSGSRRVLRGGSWRSFARLCRSALRYWDFPGNRYYFDGFRLVLLPGH
jgi:formylglycine-generating enzyme required for sulfatase activity